MSFPITALRMTREKVEQSVKSRDYDVLVEKKNYVTEYDFTA